MLKGVVFDMDYTLYDRAETDRRAILWFYETRRDMFRPDCSREYAAAQMAAASKRCSRLGWKYLAEYLYEAGVFAELPDAAALCDDYQRRYHEAIVPYSYEGGMLAELKQMHLKTGLITNGAEKYQVGKVRALGFYEKFPFVLIGSDPATAKPHPDLFLKMAGLLECAPNELIYVGDHPHYDIHAASGAGYTPVWVRACPWGDNGELPAHAIDTVAELPDYLRAHFTLPEAEA